MIVTETTTFSQIRQLLDAVERAMVLLKQEPAKIAQVVRDVERADALLDMLQANGVDVRAEEGRADSLRGRLLGDAALLVRRANKAGIAGQLANSALWGEMSALVATQRARSRRTWLIGGTATAIVALLLFVVLPWVFPTPPSANTIAVSQIAAQGDFKAALDRALAEQQQAPNDPQIGVWIGGLQQKLGMEQKAEASYVAARALTADDLTFYSSRIGVALALGDTASAKRDADALQKLPGGAAVGMYFLGAVREAQQRYGDAMTAYEAASKLASDENKPELVVMARTRLGALMQTPR